MRVMLCAERIQQKTYPSKLQMTCLHSHRQQELSSPTCRKADHTTQEKRPTARPGNRSTWYKPNDGNCTQRHAFSMQNIWRWIATSTIDRWFTRRTTHESKTFHKTIPWAGYMWLDWFETRDGLAPGWFELGLGRHPLHHEVLATRSLRPKMLFST